jgi:hypothetical protein
MAQTEIGWPFAFIAWETTSRAGQKGQNDLRSALLYSHPVSAQVARQRCPILQPGDRSITGCQPFSKRTSLLCSIGDISTLH